jgi:hypothetical protein
MSEINTDVSNDIDISDNTDVSNNTDIYYSPHNEYSIVLFIDNNVKDYQTIVNSCNSNTLPIIYSYSSTKIDILNMLSMFTTISRIGICADSNATLFLDNQAFFLNTDLDLDNSMNYSENLTFIISLIKQYNVSHIDYLACNSLNNSNWENYYQILISSTNVIVGASNNNTGNIKYGGDWITESNSQDVEFIYFTQNIEYYRYLLGNNFYKNTTDITTNFSSITQLSSFPTFNGTSNFSTKYYIKTGEVSVDLALLYALNSVPTAGTYTTEMYGYSNGIKYDLSYFFAPRPIVTSVGFSDITNSTLNNYTYYIVNNTTFTVNYDSVCIVICIGGGGGGMYGISGNQSRAGDRPISIGGGGGGGVITYVSLKKDKSYIATIGSGGNKGIDNTTPTEPTNGGNTTLTSSGLTITALGGNKGVSRVIANDFPVSDVSGNFNSSDVVSGNGIWGGGNSLPNVNGIPNNGIVLTNNIIANNTLSSNNPNYLSIPQDMYNNLISSGIDVGFCAYGGNGYYQWTSPANRVYGTGGNKATPGTSVDPNTTAPYDGTDGIGYGCGGGGGAALKTTNVNVFAGNGGNGTSGIMFISPIPNYKTHIRISGASSFSGNTNYSTLNGCAIDSTSSSGILYRFSFTGTPPTPYTASFSLNIGNMICNAMLVGPGGYGTHGYTLTATAANNNNPGNNYTSSISPSSGAGAGGVLASFAMTSGVTYTITINPGRNVRTNSSSTLTGTLTQGYAQIQSSDYVSGTSGLSITAYGGGRNDISNNSGPVGGTTAVYGANNFETYNGGNGVYNKFSNNIDVFASGSGGNGNTFNGTGLNNFSNMNTLVTSDFTTKYGTPSPSNLSVFGFGAAGQYYKRNNIAGRGGYLAAAQAAPTYAVNATGGNGYGYGTGGGCAGSPSTSAGGIGGDPVVYLYFNSTNT